MNRQDDLKRMYGTTPESFTRRVSLALKETEERHVKKLTLRTVLIAAAILALLMAAGYAAFSSQVTAFFGKLYGAETQEWLEKGDVATAHQSQTVAGIVFTVDEVVYRSNGLYGVGTIRPLENSNVLLLPQDHMPDEAYGYDVQGEGGTPEKAPDGVPTVADVALKRGAKILVVRAIPDQIGVDGATLLTPRSIGSAHVPQRDGSIRFYFELTDGYAIEGGSRYTILMRTFVQEITVEGELLASSAQDVSWTVEVQPTPIHTKKSTELSSSPVHIQTHALNMPELIVPDEYVQTGTLPIYSAAARDFGQDIQPEWFNQSGIANQTENSAFFHDGAVLTWTPEAVFYNEDGGTDSAKFKKPESEPDPKFSVTNAIFRLAGSAMRSWPGSHVSFSLENEALAAVTLEGAKATLEALLAKLNLTGYACDYALDMNLERIGTLGASMNEMKESGVIGGNSPQFDYNLATPADEGYFLSYHKFGESGVDGTGGNSSIYAYVTGQGVVQATIRDAFMPGEIDSTPEKLIDPQAVLDLLPKEIALSRYPEGRVSEVISLRLTYQPIPAADEMNGMVLSPVWQVLYRDVVAVEQEYNSWAEFDAVSGRLLSAAFK